MKKKQIKNKLLNYFSSKHSIYKTVLIIFTIYAPSSTFSVPLDAKGFFGHPYLSGLLWQIGFPIGFICAGLLINYYSKKLSEGKYLMIFLSFILMLTGGFYLIMTFFPESREIDTRLYYFIMLVSSVLLVSILHFIGRKFREAEDVLRSQNKLRLLIRNLFSFIADNQRKNRIKEEFEDDYEKEQLELVKEALEIE